MSSDERPIDRPDVFVDFDVRKGMLMLTVKNIGRASAYDVKTAFDKPFRGMGGRREMSSALLFQMIPFLPPGKALEQVIDVFAHYQRRKEPTSLTATIEYRDREGRSFREEISHDLRIYEDLVSVIEET